MSLENDVVVEAKNKASIEVKMITQCSWCDRLKYITHDGNHRWVSKECGPMMEQKYNTSLYTHGICEPCKEKEFGDYIGSGS